MTNEVHNSCNQFLFHSFLSAVHVSNESSRSSSAAQNSVLYYIVLYNSAGESNCFEAAGFACTIVPIVLCDTVHYFVLLMMNDWIRSNHVERTKNCGIKIDYKNCASCWSLTLSIPSLVRIYVRYRVNYWRHHGSHVLLRASRFLPVPTLMTSVNCWCDWSRRHEQYLNRTTGLARCVFAFHLKFWIDTDLQWSEFCLSL